MKISKVIPHVNSTITLDLVNGKEVTTKIIAINGDEVVCYRPLVFVPVPSSNGSPNVSIMALPYGHPMHDVGDEMVIDAQYIMSIMIPSQNQIDAYLKHTSGIITPASSGLVL